jgi:hypothetical protein
MFRVTLLASLIFIIAMLSMQTHGDVVSCRLQTSVAHRAGACRWLRSLQFLRAIAALAVCSGVMAPTWEVTPGAASLAFTLHPLFALTLWVCLALWLRLHGPDACALRSDMTQISRGLVRRVYLVSFLECAVRELLEPIRMIWNDQTVGADLWLYLAAPSEVVSAEFEREFRGYAIVGVLTIILIRVAMTTYSFDRGGARIPKLREPGRTWR